jgi:serine/threonine protein kinase
VLYELLAGCVPFFADSDYEVRIAHVQQAPEPPTIHYPHIPKQVVDAVMKALQKNPADRFSSVEEFLGALPPLPDTVVPQVIADTVPGTANPSGYMPVTLPPNPHLVPSPQAPETSPSFPPPSQPSGTVNPATIADATAPVPSSVQVASLPRKSNKAFIAGIAIACIFLVAGGAVWWISSDRPKESGGGAAISNSPTPAPITHSSTSDNDISAPGADVPVIPIRPGPSKTKSRAGAGSAAPNQGTSPLPDHRSGQPSPQQVVAEEGLSGSWRGTYFDSRSPQDKTLVQLQLKELNGKDIVGTLTFTKSDNTSGQCDLSRSSYSNQQLQLLLHCSGPAAEPPYFHTPAVFSVADPAERRLSGKLRYLFPTVSVNLER